MLGRLCKLRSVTEAGHNLSGYDAEVRLHDELLRRACGVGFADVHEPVYYGPDARLDRHRSPPLKVPNMIVNSSVCHSK